MRAPIHVILEVVEARGCQLSHLVTYKFPQCQTQSRLVGLQDFKLFALHSKCAKMITPIKNRTILCSEIFPEVEYAWLIVSTVLYIYSYYVSHYTMKHDNFMLWNILCSRVYNWYMVECFDSFTHSFVYEISAESHQYTLWLDSTD